MTTHGRRTGLLAVLASAVAVVAPAATGGPVPQANAVGDTITGTVTAQSDGAPLAGMRVQLFYAQYGADILVTETTTDSNGEYTLSGSDLCGTVFVQDPAGALAYTSVAQCGSGVADAVMSPGGTLTVTVTAEDNGDPIVNSCVFARLYDAEDTPTANVCTDGSGQAVFGLMPGFYRASTSAPEGSPFIGGRYDGVGSYANGEPFPVGPGHSVSIAISLPRGHRVSGTVVADDTDLPLAGVSVFVSDGSNLPGTQAAATTDASGHFATTGVVDGDYQVYFSLFDGTYTEGVESVPVTVAAGDVTGVEGRVALGVTVEGTLTDSAGNPIEGACIDNGSDRSDCHYTDAAGHYTWGGWSQVYGAYLTVSLPGYEYFSAAVELPLAVNTFDISLRSLGQVSGHVTAIAGGAPVPTGRIGAISAGSSDAYPSAWADVQPDGSYEFAGLHPGDYVFRYVGGTGQVLADAFHEGAATFATASPVTVDFETTTTDVDFQLETGGTLSGTVTDQLGDPLPGAVVTAGAGFAEERTAVTASDGTYTVVGLATGDVTVRFEGPAVEPGYQTEYFDDTRFGLETLVGVVAGQPTNGIDADLQRLARITGTLVDDATDAPLPFSVSLRWPLSGEFLDAIGYGGNAGVSTYSLDVVPGVYVVQARPEFGATQYYDQVAEFGSASLVTLEAGQTLSGVDFRVQPYPGPTFTPLSAPQRLVDSRAGQLGLLEQPGGSLGVDLAARLVPMEPQRFVVSDTGGLPTSAEGIALNVTAVNPAAKGYLTMYPCATTSSPVPATSTLNFSAGVTIANAAVLQPDDGGVCVVASKATDVILDATGVLDGRFVALPTPQRLVDSRAGQLGLVETPGGFLGDDLTTRVDADNDLFLYLGGIGGSPVGSPLALNVVAVNPSAKGFLTVYPCDSGLPATSTVNFTAGTTIANSIVVADAPALCVHASQPTDVIIDVTGYFEAGFCGDTPVRLVDSRPDQLGRLELDDGSIGEDLTVPFQPDVPQRFVLPGAGDHVGTAGYALNITAVNPSAKGYVTVYPCASTATPVPATSTLNFSKGVTIANAQIIDPDASGGLCVVASRATHLIIDATGTFG